MNWYKTALEIAIRGKGLRDPTVCADLEAFMERLVPEKDRCYTHDL